MAESGYARWLSHGTYSLLTRVVIVGFSFFNVFFMVRIMPKHDIGIWVLFSSITAILEMVRGGFIRNPFITSFVSAKEEDKASIITSSLMLHCLLALVMAAVLWMSATPIASFWNSPELYNLFLIYAINTILYIPCLHFEYLQTSRLQFKAVFYNNLIRVAVVSAYIAVHFFLNIGFSLVELALVQLFSTVVAAFFAYPSVKDLVKFNGKVNRKRAVELFHFGKFTFGTNISSMFIRSTDSWMIGRYMSTAAVAVYNPALKLANIFEVPTIAIANFIFPQIFSKMKSQGKEGVRVIYTKSVSLMLALILPMVIPLYIFADYFVETIFGPDYLEAAPILRITILYSLIIPFNRQFGTVMDGLKKPKLNFYLLVLTAVINIVLNYFGLLYFGLIGSAYGTLIAYCMVFILNQIILYRTFKINAMNSVTSIFDWYTMGWNFFSLRVVRGWR